MNALCASTHLIVPTAFTAVSAEPVGNFLAVAKAVKAKLNPHLKMVGVVETLKSTVSVSRDAADFKRLVVMLSGHEDLSIDQFVDETRRLLETPEFETNDGTPKKPVNPKLVEEHVYRLLSAGVSEFAFAAAIGELKRDKRVEKIDLCAIANRYLNEPTGGSFEFDFKSPDAAYRAMKRMFVERAQEESKAKIIKRMTG